MVMAQPHFLLFCDTHAHAPKRANWVSSSVQYRASVSGRWHFVLEQLDGTQRMEVADSERAVNRERLDLLSVVRGLEALSQPSRVTLVTTSRYVARGLRYGLQTWRDAEYKWERFGERIPIRNADLWQRIDGALQFHGVTCRLIQSSQQGSSEQALDSLAAESVSNSPLGGDFGASVGGAAAASVRDSQLSSTSRQQQQTAATGKAASIGLQAGLAMGDEAVSHVLSPRPDLRESLSKQHFFPESWWHLIEGWVRWWRNRWHAKPALFGS